MHSAIAYRIASKEMKTNTGTKSYLSLCEISNPSSGSFELFLRNLAMKKCSQFYRTAKEHLEKMETSLKNEDNIPLLITEHVAVSVRQEQVKIQRRSVDIISDGPTKLSENS